MQRVLAIFILFLSFVSVPSVASAALKPDDDPTITEGLRDKGVDWLKDKAKEAGKSWVFDTGQSETMHEILLKARERADGEGNDRKGLCQYAVMGKASSILSDINTKWTVKTAGLLAFDTTVKMASLASGFGAAAGEGNAINWLVEQYTDAAKDAGKDAVFDKIKELFGKEEKPEFELYETSGKNGACDYTLRAVWDIVHGTYRVYIAGDCHCQKVGQFGLEPTPLGKWWITFEGHVKLNVDPQKRTTSWTVLPVSWMDFDAQCACSKRELRKAFARNEKPTVTTGTTPGSSTPAGPPPLAPAGRKVCKECQKIQEEIDADQKALGEAQAQVQVLAEQLVEAKARLESAKEKLAAVKASPKDYDITPEAVERQVQTSEGDVRRITTESDRLVNEQVRLMEALRDLARQLEECIKACEGKSSTSQPPTETPPIAPENKKKGVSYEPGDPFARQILDIHNLERTSLGTQPLRWNPQLALDATAWAQEMARTGEEVHAPREGRGIERENLNKGLIGWNADQMTRNWINERRDFVAGIYPDVARDGNWVNVSHYTQMIWPTTTDIGCGIAIGRGFQWLDCRYSPGGNKPGKPVGYAFDAPNVGFDQGGFRVEVERPTRSQGTRANEAATAYQWIDVKTGEPVPVVSGTFIAVGTVEASLTGANSVVRYHPIRIDPGDPARAFVSATGQNLARDETGNWIDVNTGKSAPTVNGTFIAVGEVVPRLSGAQTVVGYQPVQVDPVDPTRAFVPKTGQNLTRVPVQPVRRTGRPERG